MMLANSNVACFAHTIIWQQEQAVFVQSVRIWQSFIQEQLTVLPVPSAEGGIAGEQERELVPLQHLCVSTLFLQKRDSGGVRGKTSSILYCRSLCFLSNGWQAQLTRNTLLSCLSPPTASLSEALLLLCNCWQVDKVQLKAFTHGILGLWALNSLQLCFLRETSGFLCV